METYNKKAVWADLNKFDILAKDDDFIEVSEWKNAEGVDISIGDKKQFSLTYGEISAIVYLSKKLEYEF